MMMLWTWAITGSPGSMPPAPRIGISVSPKASNASWESHTSKTRRSVLALERAVVAAPGGSALSGGLELADDVVVLLVDAMRDASETLSAIVWYKSVNSLSPDEELI
jgi:hypothetical protein